MAIPVIMPKQGLQMTQGTIVKWLRREGERIEAGEPLFEIQTDKVTIEIDSPGSGTLLKILRKEGEIVPVAQTVAIIGEPGEDISSLPFNVEVALGDVVARGSDLLMQETGDVPRKVRATPRAKKMATEVGIQVEAIEGTGPDGLITEFDVKRYVDIPLSHTRATPLAKKAAAELGVSLAATEGSGVSGRITKEDVEKAALARHDNNGLGYQEEIVPLNEMRKIISARMMKSLHSMAQATHRIKVNMSEVIRLRQKLMDDGIKVSFNDIFIKIVAKALIEYPMINSSLTEEGILVKHYVNIGIAVSLKDGLIVPVVKNAHLLQLSEISKVLESLLERAANGRLVTDDYSGGTFTLTNLGMYGVDDFIAIINPPESAILAVGKIEQAAVVEEGEIFIKPMVVLSLTYDHRVIDGAPAAEFLGRIKQLLVNPYLLL